jgi:uncharacterized protein YlxW (UPF0749 family)
MDIFLIVLIVSVFAIIVAWLFRGANGRDEAAHTSANQESTAASIRMQNDVTQLRADFKALKNEVDRDKATRVMQAARDKAGMK